MVRTVRRPLGQRHANVEPSRRGAAGKASGPRKEGEGAATDALLPPGVDRRSDDRADARDASRRRGDPRGTSTVVPGTTPGMPAAVTGLALR